MRHYEILDRLDVITGIERELETKVITFYRNALNNQGLIDENVYRDFHTAINSIGNYDPLLLLIHTRGGYTYSGWRIASCLMNRVGPTTVIVPEEALSMGTMITLSADRIIIFPDAHLSPIDPQMQHNNMWVSALDLLDHEDRLIRRRAKKAIDLAEENLRQLCRSKLSGKKLDRLVNRFLLKDKKHASHASSIFFNEVKRLGLSVRKQEISDVKALHMLYQRHIFSDKDPSTIIEYTRTPIPKSERTILEKVASREISVEDAEKLLRLSSEETSR